MFLDNGWRVGVGTRLKGSKPSGKDIKEKEFNEFIDNVNKDLKNHMKGFAEIHGENYDEVMKNKGRILYKYDGYAEFLKLYNHAVDTIDKMIYSGNKGVTARRKVTNDMDDVKNYFQNKFPGYEVEESQIGQKSGYGWKTLIFLIVLILVFILVFISYMKESGTSEIKQSVSEIKQSVSQTTIQTKTSESIQKDKEIIINKLKTIPTKQYEKNLVLYKKLLQYEPNNKKYQKKVKFYETKITNKKGSKDE